MNVSKKRWGYLAVAVLILLFAGIGYAFSLFVGAIEQDLGLTRADTSLVFTLCFICFASGSLVTGFLLRRLSPKILLRVGAVMIGAGFLMSAGAARLWQLYFTYSILCGFSIGIAYNVMISMIPLFFHDKVGLATGILLMGFAMSTTVLGPFCQMGMSAFGWRGVFLALGGSEAAAFFIGSVVIHAPSGAEEKALAQQQKALAQREKAQAQAAVCDLTEAEKTFTQPDFSPCAMIRMKSFYVFISIYISIGGVGMAFINHGAMTLQEDLGQSLALSTLIVGAVCMFNGIGRVLWGIVYDRIGSAASLRYLGILLILALGAVLGSLYISSVWLFAFGMALVMFCYGGSSSLAPIIVRALFGDNYFSANFAITNIGTMILSSVPALIGMIQMHTGSYTAPYILLSAFAAVSFFMACLYRKVTERELGHVC
ncbi:MFS transporter [Clostridium sp. AN503]|uniref:MFS transporter n=1 Tax=Clostridium sp. AN503 TaxID=3160598 RepID=UPI00345A30DD